ncbi:MAG: choline kinase [Desulfuromonas sp.]|nr:MAG: choline kinase [Desulfuromonas sp.]
MPDAAAALILGATGGTSLELVEGIQELWSGYGATLRYRVHGGRCASVVVKQVRLPEQDGHPRGWNTELSHQRKLRSYQVESAWYRDWSSRCGSGCRVPHCLAIESCGDETLMVFEDLDAAGFAQRRTEVTPQELRLCLDWLANFHATFLGDEPCGLWPQGTYWHLATRPDELQALDDPALKAAAPELDRLLRECRFRTLVHGDAKLANFCFADEGQGVAAVDFQYVGGGCGMQDVAYFIGSCLGEEDCRKQVPQLLDYYFATLERMLKVYQPQLDGGALEAEWRALFPVAWTDFHRFLKGWSPGHWKLNTYSEQLAREMLRQLADNRRGCRC